MKTLALILTMVASPALAQDATSRDNVLGCVYKVDAGATWNQCLGLMFLSCDSGAVGTREHAACLLNLREDWRLDMVARQTEVLKAITPEGGGKLADLLAAWPTYVGQKCTAVAANGAETQAASARLGCEISEMVLISSEFQACIDGQSSEDYCVHAN